MWTEHRGRRADLAGLLDLKEHVNVNSRGRSRFLRRMFGSLGRFTGAVGATHHQPSAFVLPEKPATSGHSVTAPRR